jgi:acyl-CoA synthetase (AMP-forming)/AMP-acid ligase II
MRSLSSLLHVPVVERLAWRARHRPDQLAFAYLLNGEVESSRITYKELDRAARALAARLLRDASPGDRALLLYPQSLDFIVSLFACLYAGILAVPVCPPEPARLNRSLTRLMTVAADARPAVVLTTTTFLDAIARSHEPGSPLGSLRWIATDSDDTTDGAELPPPDIDAVALLQYTSGSTSQPKGVVLTQGNLAANATLFARAYGLDESDVVVSWLPVCHDMGLIGSVIAAVYTGYPTILLSAADVSRKPVRWLHAMTVYGATASAAPDSGYALCARHTRPADLEEVDLRAWKTAVIGAEPVRADTLASFVEAFAHVGFDERAFAPSYGLAESTLYVTSSPVRAGATLLAVDASALTDGHVVRRPLDAEGSRSLVACGPLGNDGRVAVVDPASRTKCADNRVGEIWVRGESVARGYWNRPDETKDAFGATLATGEGPYVRTGDLGFAHDGELFVSGRLHDVISVRGSRHDAHEIECTVEAAHPALRPGGCAAFAVDVDGEAHVGILAEIRDIHDPPDAEDIRAAIRDAIARNHDLPVAGVALLGPSTLPKTPSGKIERYACRQAFLDDRIPEA